ncbi:MAG: hypothetical protein IPK11_08730 [Ignavibacteria bacterium]|nr:hypothetical protein [Ignavibacteria bacterium]
MGDKVISACEDRTEKIWDVGTGSLLKTLSGHNGVIRTAEFNSTGDKVVTASGDSRQDMGQIRVIYSLL